MLLGAGWEAVGVEWKRGCEWSRTKIKEHKRFCFFGMQKIGAYISYIIGKMQARPNEMGGNKAYSYF